MAESGSDPNPGSGGAREQDPFDAAFAAAKEEVSSGAAGDGGGDGDGESAAGAGDGDGAAAAKDDSDKQAAGQTQGQGQPAKEPAKEVAQEEFPELEGVTDEAIKTAYRNLPPEVRKANNVVFTRHTQRLAEHARTVEAGAKVIEALRADPIAAVRQMAREAGVKLVDPEIESSQATAEALAQSLSGAFTPEQIAALTPVLKTAVESSQAPLAEVQSQIAMAAAERILDAELAEFSKEYPDWKEYEAEIAAFINERDFKDDVPNSKIFAEAYQLASHSKKFEERVKAEVEKRIASMGKKAKEAGAAPSGSGTPPTQVVQSPSKNPTIEEAWAAAKQGIRFE